MTTTTHTSTLVNETADLVNDELASYGLIASVQNVSGDYPYPWAGVDYRSRDRRVRIFEDDGTLVVIAQDRTGGETGRATFAHSLARPGIVAPIAAAYLR